MVFTLLLIAFGAMFQFQFFVKNSFVLVRCAHALRRSSAIPLPCYCAAWLCFWACWSTATRLRASHLFSPRPPWPPALQIFLLFFLFQCAMVSVAFLLSGGPVSAPPQPACLPRAGVPAAAPVGC